MVYSHTVDPQFRELWTGPARSYSGVIRPRLTPGQRYPRHKAFGDLGFRQGSLNRNAPTAFEVPKRVVFERHKKALPTSPRAFRAAMRVAAAETNENPTIALDGMEVRNSGIGSMVVVAPRLFWDFHANLRVGG